jgi:hypothetical protein
MGQEAHRQALAHYNQGCALQGHADWEGAIACYDAALALDASLAAAHSNRGAALASLNRCEEALVSLDRAIILQPDHAEAHFSRAVTLLLQGDLPAGWREFEWRWQTAPGRALRRSKDFTQPRWLGGRGLEGQTLLLHCERGLGDTLQFCRYALQVAELRAGVILQVQAPLLALLRRSFLRSPPEAIQVVSETDELPHFDLQCPLLSLPLAFATALQTIPAPARYLSADPGLVAHWQSRLEKSQGPRVGVVWRGDARNPDDSRRSIALTDLLECLPRQLQYYSLQKDLAPWEETVLCPHPHLAVVADELDFERTAALCECLDLVISIDSSVAHLSAALGKPTWILLPFNPDCRWLLNREDSPWYPSVTLYRQSAAGNWRAVLQRLAADLALRVPAAANSSPTSCRSS